MKRFLPFFIVLFAVCLMACHDKIVAPEDAPKEALMDALEALNRGDYDAYMSHVDYGVEMDTMRMTVMRNALRQHIDWCTARKSSVTSIDVVEVEMEGDTVCTVFYRYTYADGTDEVAVQKMVRRGEEWMLRARN